MSYGAKSSKLYIGNLPADVTDREVERLFKKYGRIKDVDVKNRHESSFAFVEFDSSRDAEEALYGRNNYRFEGRSIKVEMSKGSNRRDSSGGGYRGSYNGRFNDRDNGSGGRSNFKRTKARSTEWRLRVSGLPLTTSWQDLKDHMKAAGEVSYADTNRDGTGVCDYNTEDDLLYALKSLQGSEIKTFKGDVGRIKLSREGAGSDRRSGGGRRSSTRSRSRGESPGAARRSRRSPAYSNNNSRSSSSS